MDGQNRPDFDWEWFRRMVENLEKLMKRIEAGQASQQWFTVKEAAELLGKSPYTIREYAKSGRLKHERDPRGAGGKGEWRFSLDAINEFREPKDGRPGDPEAGSAAKPTPRKPTGGGQAVIAQ